METLSDKKSRRMQVDFGNPSPLFPREVLFDLNNTCNCRCFFCANPKIAKNAHLDKNLGFTLLQDFFDLGTREIAFYSTGEPFLRRDLAEFVEKAKKIGYEYIFIASNGILATPKTAKPVLDAGLDSIKFSVNAGTKESYKAVHGVDAFDKVIKNIKWFHQYRRKSGLGYRIYVSMVPSSRTDKDDLAALTALISPYVDELDCRDCSNQGGSMYENNLTENIDKNNILGSLKENQRIGRCPDVFFRTRVTPEGYLSACCADYQNYLVVADLNNTPVKDAWNNKKYISLRKRHMANDLNGTICHNCLNNCRENVAPLSPEYAAPFIGAEKTKKKKLKKEKNDEI